jgi:NO-binding membrane sensor protein with MHYT domain
MLRVLGCVTEQHDVWLVGVAALVCALACVTSLSLLGRGLMPGGTWLPSWRAGAAVTFGGGVWATHFVAMLAYRPGQPFGFAVPLTLGSLLLPMCPCSGGWPPSP